MSSESPEAPPEESPPTTSSTPQASEGVTSSEDVRHSLPCPYNGAHLVPIDDFNAHVWKCRTERMTFYPHSLKLKRCTYNTRHFLPEEELPFHEIFCKSQTAEMRSQLATDPIFLDVADFLEAQKIRQQLDDDDVDSEDNNNDSDDSDDENKKCKSVTSEVEKSDVEEEDDMEVTMKRLEYLEMKKKINL